MRKLRLPEDLKEELSIAFLILDKNKVGFEEGKENLELGCGGYCQVTCSFYCEATCGESCSSYNLKPCHLAVDV